MMRFSNSLKPSRPAARLLVGLALLACFAFVLHGGAHVDTGSHPECPACQIVGKSASCASSAPVEIASPDWVRARYESLPEVARAQPQSGQPLPRGPPA